MKELKEKLVASNQKGHVIDLKKFNIAGVKVVNDYEFEIKIYGKYPQFKYWLAMNFFAPIPWEAEAFFSQTDFENIHCLRIEILWFKKI